MVSIAKSQRTSIRIAGELSAKTRYREAEAIYLNIATENPEIARSFAFNIALIWRRSGNGNPLSQLVEAAELFVATTKASANALQVALTLAPSGNIKVVARRYFATSPDPHFEVRLLSPITGFALVKANVEYEDKGRHAILKLYEDRGKGYTEERSSCVQIESCKSTSFVIYTPALLSGLRFDPIDQDGFFGIREFSLTPLNEAEARRIMNVSLGTEYTDKSPDTCAIELYGRYSSEMKAKCMEDSGEYGYYIQNIEASLLPTRDDAISISKRMPEKPLISIIMPTYNTCPEHLADCIHSVREQTYPNWELCIADDGSTKAETINVLKSFENQDSRIKVFYRSKNGHISAASNTALSLATGDYTCFLDHDDVLSPHALFFIALAINAWPSAGLIYTDEDKLSREGNRESPHFKSDWNYDLLLSQNYICHLCAIRKDIIDTVGGFREGFEGGQDHDLILRCSSIIDKSDILHIPLVLYHWRISNQSTAGFPEAKDYTSNASLLALTDHLAKTGKHDAIVETGKYANTYRIRWPFATENLPKVDIIIPTRDKGDVTQRAVESIIEKTDYDNYMITVIDNGSADPASLAILDHLQSRYARLQVVRYDKPFNFSKINNYAASITDGDVLALLNNDIEIINSEWLAEMVSLAIREGTGCVGAKLYYPNNTIQHAGVILGIGGVAGHSHKYFSRESPGYFSRLGLVQSVSAVTAAALVVRRNIYIEVGGLNEKCLAVAFNDVDFCMKVLEAGYTNIWTPYAELYHHESLSRGTEDSPEKVMRFNSEVDYMKRTWGRRLAVDRYYSPNLTLEREDFGITSVINGEGSVMEGINRLIMRISMSRSTGLVAADDAH